MLEKHLKRYRRHRRVRAKIQGTVKTPRLCVFRSANHIYAQLIDDEKGKTLLSASDLEINPVKFALQLFNGVKKRKEKKAALAAEVGRIIAKKAVAKKINKVIFDRGGYKYHGRVKSLAEGAREGGLKF